MVGDMVWQAARRGSADRTVFASADHHCLGEEVRALNDIDAKQLDEKQMGSVIYLRRYCSVAGSGLWLAIWYGRQQGMGMECIPTYPLHSIPIPCCLPYHIASHNPLPATLQ